MNWAPEVVVPVSDIGCAKQFDQHWASRPITKSQVGPEYVPTG